VSPPWVAYYQERRGEVRCDCRRVSPSCATDFPEERRGLLWLVVGEGPMECDVPKLAKDPFGLLVPLCCKVDVVVSLVRGHRSAVLGIKSVR